jgi:hypothetical protein
MFDKTLCSPLELEFGYTDNQLLLNEQLGDIYVSSLGLLYIAQQQPASHPDAAASRIEANPIGTNRLGSRLARNFSRASIASSCIGFGIPGCSTFGGIYTQAHSGTLQR